MAILSTIKNFLGGLTKRPAVPNIGTPQGLLPGPLNIGRTAPSNPSAVKSPSISGPLPTSIPLPRVSAPGPSSPLKLTPMTPAGPVNIGAGAPSSNLKFAPQPVPRVEPPTPSPRPFGPQSNPSSPLQLLPMGPTGPLNVGGGQPSSNLNYAPKGDFFFGLGSSKRPMIPRVAGAEDVQYSNQFVGPGGLIEPTLNVVNQDATAPAAKPAVPLIDPEAASDVKGPIINKAGINSETSLAAAALGAEGPGGPIGGSMGGASGGALGASGPAVPYLNPDLTAAYEKASKAYQDALNLSSDELATQEDLDKLIESSKRAYTDIEDKPIPMQFITGQQASVERRAKTLAEPLERKLARMQAARLASLDASKFALEQSGKRLSEDREYAYKDKEAAESARRFEVSTGLTKEQMAQSAKESERRAALDEKKFDEDRRQFGLNYALEQAKLAQTKSEKTAEKEKDKEAQQSSLIGNLQLADDLLKGDFKGITGGGPFGKSILTRLGMSNQRESNQFKQLKANLSLENRQKLKGSGAVSDFEAKTLEQASTALDTNLSNKDFEAELKKVRGVLRTASGLEAEVKVTSPNGETINANASRKEIEALIAEGNKVVYR